MVLYWLLVRSMSTISPSASSAEYREQAGVASESSCSASLGPRLGEPAAAISRAAFLLPVWWTADAAEKTSSSLQCLRLSSAVAVSFVRRLFAENGNEGRPADVDAGGTQSGCERQTVFFPARPLVWP